MSECRESCNCKELFARFTQAMEGRLDTMLMMTTGNDLCGYAAQRGCLPCELDMMGIKGFLDLLYSLESVVFTEDNIRKEFHVVKLFYDFLQEAGCVQSNPAGELRAAAVRQLLGRLQEKGFTDMELPEVEEDDEVKGGEQK